MLMADAREGVFWGAAAERLPVPVFRTLFPAQTDKSELIAMKAKE